MKELFQKYIDLKNNLLIDEIDELEMLTNIKKKLGNL